MSISTAVVAMVGALLPDIDHPSSYIGRQFWFVSRPLSKVIGHRGLTHSLLAFIGVTMWIALQMQALPVLVTALCVGYLSHILADFITRGGVPLLWPWPKRFAMPFAVKTGGSGEFIITLALAVWAMLTLWWHLFP